MRAATGVSAALGVWAPEASPSPATDAGTSAAPALAQLPAINAAMLEAKFLAAPKTAARQEADQGAVPAPDPTPQDRAAGNAAELAGSGAEQPQPEAGSSGRQSGGAAQEQPQAGDALQQQGLTECRICYNLMEVAMVRTCLSIPSFLSVLLARLPMAATWMHFIDALALSVQLLPCGHTMCEACFAQQLKRACWFCRKPFGASEVFRCPVALQRQQTVGEDPKYAQVHTLLLPEVSFICCALFIVFTVWSAHIDCTCLGRLR